MRTAIGPDMCLRRWLKEQMGGDLTSDEIGVIRGALDLTSKTARSECTPLDKVPWQNLHTSCPPTYVLLDGS